MAINISTSIWTGVSSTRHIPSARTMALEDFLDFIVVGGGIAGLATAWSLQNAGHRVTLFEQHHPHVLSKCREGVRSPPTMTQIFNDWGLGDQLSKISTPIKQITFLDGKTGEELGLITISDKVMESLPAGFSCVQYGELFSIFYNLARDAGVDLFFGTKIVSVDPLRATVTAEDGRCWTADVIVGADGTDSIVRPVVTENSIPVPDRDNRFTVNLLVPADAARKDEELAALLDKKTWTGWCADDCSMHGVLTGTGPNHDYALVMSITIRDGDDWQEFPMGFDSLRPDLFEPRAQKLLKLSEQVSKDIFTHYEPFDNWVHESGKVVLLGEAAHPIIPTGSLNICAGIEDAVTLSTLFSLPMTRHQTPILLNAFEELRQPRCASVQRYVRRKREIFTIPPGPARRQRDQLLRDQRTCHQDEEPDDESVYSMYTGFIQVYGFDAREAVQDWWATWGRSITIHSPKSESDEEDDEEDDPILVLVVVDTEVEREGESSKYPIISDPLMGEDEYVVREVEAIHWRSDG